MKKQKIGLVAGITIVILALGYTFMGIQTPVERFKALGQVIQSTLRESPLQAQIKEWKNIGTNQYEPTFKQIIYRDSLIWCESRAEKTALNPKDRNGLRSVGILQFQDLTFRYYVARYQLLDIKNLEEEDWQNWIWDADLQIEIVTRMMGEDTNWRQQFPDCVRKLGYPPKGL